MAPVLLTWALLLQSEYTKLAMWTMTRSPVSYCKEQQQIEGKVSTMAVRELLWMITHLPVSNCKEQQMQG